MKTKVLESIHGKISKKKKKKCVGGRSFVLIFLKEWGHCCPWERGSCEMTGLEGPSLEIECSIY